jgi:hypothetical protein
LRCNTFACAFFWPADCLVVPRSAESHRPFENGTPAARPVRKARDLSEIARPPKKGSSLA